MTLMVLFFEICYYFVLSVFKLLQKNKQKKNSFVAFKKTSFISIASGLCAFCGTQWNTNSTRLFFLWPQLQSSMILPCPSYARWDSRWRPAEKPCTTLATLESIPPWIGSWPIWKTRVCRTAQSWPEKKKILCQFARLNPRVLLLCDWLQISLPLWCCQAVALALEPHPQRVCQRITWQPSSPWASVETRQPKHFAPRLESNSLDFSRFLSTTETQHTLNWLCFRQAFKPQIY